MFSSLHKHLPIHILPNVPAGQDVSQFLPIKPGLQIDNLHLHILRQSSDISPGLHEQS